MHAKLRAPGGSLEIRWGARGERRSLPSTKSACGAEVAPLDQDGSALPLAECRVARVAGEQIEVRAQLAEAGPQAGDADTEAGGDLRLRQGYVVDVHDGIGHARREGRERGA